MPESADVFYGTLRAGTLTRSAEGFQFRYDPDYLRDPAALPVSLALPLRGEPYQSRELFPFFDGLLPEGWLLALSARALKIDAHDRWGLLMHTGADTVGAVTVRPAEPPQP